MIRLENDTSVELTVADSSTTYRQLEETTSCITAGHHSTESKILPLSHCGKQEINNNTTDSSA